MEIRLIRPGEWDQLAPIFQAEGGRLPDPMSSTAAVAIDDEGKIAGFWALQLCWHAGPLWIRPDQRKKGLWRRLHALVDSVFLKRLGTGYYSFSGEPRVEAMFRELGYRDLGYRVWAKESK